MRTLRPLLLGVLALALVVPAVAQDAPKPATTGAAPAAPAAPGTAPAPSTDPRVTPRPGEATPAPVAGQPARPGGEAPAQSAPPNVLAGDKLNINFEEADLYALVQFFSRVTGTNFVLGDQRDLQGKKVTILSNKPVSPAAAYEAFMSALEVHGLTIVRVGEMHKILKATDAQRSPGRPGEGGDIKLTDQYITQIIPFENIAVADVREIVDNLVSPNAKVLAYAPSNTLILTDTGYNVKRIYDIVSKLDIAAPRSSLEIYQIVYANATELKTLIEELYGTAEKSSSGTAQAQPARPARRAARTPEPAPAAGGGVTAGEKSNYISKVLSDERTNAVIALADEQGHAAIKDLIAKLDVDVDPTSRSQIYVYRLEHAKAEDVAKVLQDLSQNASSRTSSRGGQGNQQNVDPRVAAARARAEAAQAAADAARSAGGDEEQTGAIAAFDSGLRIAYDEATNALVIIASRDDYQVIESVIRELDQKRKMVFVDAVILEMSATDSFSFDLAYHAPFTSGDATGVVGGQFGTNSLGLSLASLTGLAFGVFGQSVPVPVIGADGSPTSISVPAFGIALDALKSNQLVNIVSSPSLLALDNEESKISVGRKIPFPINSGLNGLGQPVISFQREDVAITLEMTPRVNSENFVTMELKVGVQEIEGSAQQANVQQGGFITSERKLETSALVGDNQTVVLGGLISTTENDNETKIPVLGDLPVIGALFRNKARSSRQTNLMIFLTPHIIDDEADMEEIMRVKEAQRAEFLRRFYGKTQQQQFEEIRKLLQYSMNEVDAPSAYRGPTTISSTATLDGEPISASSRAELRDEVERGVSGPSGDLAGKLPAGEVAVEMPAAEPAAPAEAPPAAEPTAPTEGE